MGRVARQGVTFLLSEPNVAVTLLADGKRADVLRVEFPGAPVVPVRSARRRDRYAIVWFPFNGMHFVPAAPALVTMHDAFAFTEPERERIARFRVQSPMRRAARYAARIAVDSDWTRDEVARVLGVELERLTVVAPQADAFFTPLQDGADRLPIPLEGKRYVLLVGVRERRKNARLALEACARALRGDETLVVVGALSPADRTRALALRLRCGEIAASDRTLRTLYRGAALVLVPSLAEGFGLVAAEAIACGAAVVASNVSALPEATRGAALLLDPNDVGLWARTVRALLDEPGPADALRARARTCFASVDRAAYCGAMLALLRQTAAMRARDRGNQFAEPRFEAPR